MAESEIVDKDARAGEEDERARSSLDWKNAKSVAGSFFAWLHSPPEEDEDSIEAEEPVDRSSLDLNSINREQVHNLFDAFKIHYQVPMNKKVRRLESLVMSALRRQRLFRSKRYNDGVVICSFAQPNRTFAPLKERQTARDLLLKQRATQEADKKGIAIPKDPIFDPPNDQSVLPVNQTVKLFFPIVMHSQSNANETAAPLLLIKIRTSGPHKKHFEILTQTPCPVVLKTKHDQSCTFQLSFRPKFPSVYRAAFELIFKGADEEFSILRTVFVRAGNSDIYDILKPTTPYVKKQRKKYEKPVKSEDIVHPPPRSDRGAGVKYRNLRPFKVPVDVRELVENREMENAMVAPSLETTNDEFSDVYSTFWKNLLWTSELQAYEDIKLFDIEDVSMEKNGKFFKLHVAGLAEGRPSVLRGDLVFCSWKGKQYHGRVSTVELLDVLIEFHHSFHMKFNVKLDRVDLVRFTFSRTSIRTSHAGCLLAPSHKNMGRRMLMPTTQHVTQIRKNAHQQVKRIIPNRFAWTSHNINGEQMEAVKQISQGALRPMPYIIFGPPGTGKTTTMTEAVYHLARLHKYSKKQKKLNILLVAPSNDAADILVEKLSPYFPPSEMMRVLAYTRPVNEVSSIVRPYVQQGLESQELPSKIMTFQIVVSTVNLAARFWCIGDGVKKGYFDVLCVDEAGHATEPEVIAVAAPLMNFHGKDPGQLVLAGDPRQLGPIITSDLCKKFGMDVSYMERLVRHCPAYGALHGSDGNTYPPELLTLLVRNYRSHPTILQLPNNMFYDGKLIPSGDPLTIQSMERWEHLPSQNKFPVVFYATDGENLREGNSPSWFNPQEVSVVVEYVKLLMKQSRPAMTADDVGVITPYARQVQKIRMGLKKHNMDDVKVGSVETFQGQERRCIIISTVRSENQLLEHDLKYNLGFVANEKRFNVAVTRAKALLIVIGNPRVLASDKKNWLPFLRYCRDNESWAGDEWDEEDADELLTVEQKQDGGKELEEEDETWDVVADQEACGYINREE